MIVTRLASGLGTALTLTALVVLGAVGGAVTASASAGKERPSAGEDFEGQDRGYDGDGLGAGATGDGSDDDIGADEYVPHVSHTVTVAVAGNGEVDPGVGAHTYDEGKAVRMGATAATDWDFGHWEGNLTGTENPTTLTVDGDKRVTAVFVAETPADINADGATDAIDVQLVINAALGLTIGGLDADVNGDGGVDALDVQLVVNGALAISLKGASSTSARD